MSETGFMPSMGDDALNSYMAQNPHAFMPGETFGGGNINDQMTTYQVQEKDLSFAIFYPRAIQDPVASREAKRPQFKMVPYIQIMQPGENTHKIDRPAKPEDVERSQKEWTRFQARTNNGAIGTPLEALFPYHPEIVLNLKASNVLSVEALASLTDAAMSAMGLGAGEMKERARRYLVAVSNPEGAKMAERDAAHEQTRADLIRSNELLQATQRRLETLEAQLAAMKTGASVGPLTELPAASGQLQGAGVYSQPLGDEIPESEWNGGGQTAVDVTEKRGPGRPRKS
jgi:hypothetical protein